MIDVKMGVPGPRGVAVFTEARRHAHFTARGISTT